MKTVFVTWPLPDEVLETLRAAGHEVRVHPEARLLGRQELLAGVADASALVCLLLDRIDTTVLDAAPKLRVVSNVAVGFDNIDLEACRDRGIAVTNTPGVLTEATADLTLALILACARRLGEAERLVRSGTWEGWRPDQLLGLELTGARLGVVGAGRIGSAVARRARAFGMRVDYCDGNPRPDFESELGARRLELDELLAQCDVVSLHVPLTDETRQLIDARRLALMKPHSILVNTSRGPVVQEAALVEALRRGRPGSAGLDVYEGEPRLAPGLAELPNVVLLPHLGSATRHSRREMARLAVEGASAVLEGRMPEHAVVPPP